MVVKIGDEKKLSVSESQSLHGSDGGPVNALARALAKDLGPYQACIDDIQLVDFKVRITQGGTDAVTRVIIDSEDGAGPALVDGGGEPQHRRRLASRRCSTRSTGSCARRLRAGGGDRAGGGMTPRSSPCTPICRARGRATARASPGRWSWPG